MRGVAFASCSITVRLGSGGGSRRFWFEKSLERLLTWGGLGLSATTASLRNQSASFLRWGDWRIGTPLGRRYLFCRAPSHDWLFSSFDERTSVSQHMFRGFEFYLVDLLAWHGLSVERSIARIHCWSGLNLGGGSDILFLEHVANTSSTVKLWDEPCGQREKVFL